MFTRLESRRRSEARSLRPTIVAGLSRVRRRAEPGQTGSKSRHTIGLATTGVLQRPVPGCSIEGKRGQSFKIQKKRGTRVDESATTAEQSLSP